jgi:hypothetical protein
MQGAAALRPSYLRRLSHHRLAASRRLVGTGSCAWQPQAYTGGGGTTRDGRVRVGFTLQVEAAQLDKSGLSLSVCVCVCVCVCVWCLYTCIAAQLGAE